MLLHPAELIAAPAAGDSGAGGHSSPSSTVSLITSTQLGASSQDRVQKGRNAWTRIKMLMLRGGGGLPGPPVLFGDESMRPRGHGRKLEQIKPNIGMV